VNRGAATAAQPVMRIQCLDGTRGIAALWVLAGHCMLLTGFSLPIVGSPDLGVDLFVLLSGYLMTYQYLVRRHREDWSRSSTWRAFWIRRFFRLSPLYFPLLIVALIAGAGIYADRVFIDQALGRPLQLEERYADLSIGNIAMHLTYLYGLFPDYAFRTPLPDWSLGLEMQFYAVFPFLIVLHARMGWLRMTACVALAAFAVALGLKAMHIRFPMPSFLPLKLHVFLAGILIAAAPRNGKHLVAAMILMAFPYGGSIDALHVVVREALVVAFFLVVNFQDRPVVGAVSRTLGSKPFYWLGELSYGCYLIHLLILHPVAAWVLAHGGLAQPPSWRFMTVFPVVVIVTYALAAVGYHVLEKPGQQWGRRLLEQLHLGGKAWQTTAEKIDAP